MAKDLFEVLLLLDLGSIRLVSMVTILISVLSTMKVLFILS